MSQADTMQPKRSILALSLGISFTAVTILVAAVFIAGAPTAEAAVYTLTGLCGACNWSDPTKWSGGAVGTTPGQAAGDTAQIGCLPTLTVDIPVANGVVLNLGCTGASVLIPGAPATNSLQIEASSNLGSAGNVITVNGGSLVLNSGAGLTNTAATITLNSGIASNSGAFINQSTVTIAGGTFTNTGAISVQGFGGLLNLNGGTLVNNGTLASGASSTFLFHGGTLSGPGSTTFAGATVNFDGAQGPMVIDGGQTLGVNATITLSGVNPLSLNNGSTMNFNNGAAAPDGIFSLISDAPIQTAGTPGIINLLGGGPPPGTLQKIGGVGLTPIFAVVNNAGGVTTPVSGVSIAFNGGGTHTGIFLFGPATSFLFGGNHTFNPGATFSGIGDVTITPGIFTINEPPFFSFPGNLTNSGELKFGPGSTTQQVSVNSNYTQTPTGILDVKLNGTTAGTTYDQLLAGGTASLGGTLNATLGFAPVVDGTTWDIVNGKINLTGDFAVKNLPTYATGKIAEIPTPPGPNDAFLVAVPLADLALAKNGPSSVLNGQNATYTIDVVNNGPAIATAIVTDNYSGAGATLVSVSPAANCTSSPPFFVTCTFPAMAVGAAQTITLVLNASAAGTMTDTASAAVATPGQDPFLGNNAGFVSTAVAAAADLAVNSVTGAPNPVNAGASETWQVAIGNNGPDPATSVVANLSFTGGGTMLTAGGGGFTCVINPPASAQCTNPSMAAATTATITVTSSAPNVASVWTLNANVNSATADPNLANNSLSGSVNVAASADIGVIKTLSGSAIAGGNAVYNISVGNKGPSDAANVTVNDTPGAGLTLVSVTGSGCVGFPCVIALLPNGSNTTITATFAVASNATTVTNTATANSPAFDSNPGDNTSSTTTAVVIKADLAVMKTGPASALAGATVTYTITVSNYGPSDATGVVLSDPPSAGLTLVSVSGSGCTSFPCTLGTMLSGDICTVFATYTIQKGFTSVTNKATVTATTADPNLGNNSGSATTKVGPTCPTSAPINPFPVDGATNVPSSGSLGWTNVGAATYKVYLGPAGSGCTTLLGTTNTSSIAYSGLTSGTQYEWRVEAEKPGCPTLSSTCFTFTAGGCPNTPPTLIAPANGSTVSGLVTFSWNGVAGAVDYKVFAGVGAATPTELGTTTDTTLMTSVDAGQVSWYVVAEFAAPCPPVQSATSSFNACGTSAPIPNLVSEVYTNQTYTLGWTPVNGATTYEVDEARDVSFTQGLSTQTVNGTSVQFQHTVSAPTAFFYRVRAFVSCLNGFGPNSQTVRVVLDLIPPPDTPNPNVNVPAGSSRVVVQIIHVPGFPDGTFPFAATVDKPWLQVAPSSGLLPPEGIDLTVTADPTSLPNGTQTGTVLVTIGSGSGPIRTNGTTTVSVPVSISLVTPVSPTKPADQPPPNALIVAAVGHLDGINSRWQSDVSVSNIASSDAQYELTFTPDDPAKGVKQTIITAGAQATIALSDIVRNWYGVGSLGETANGVLEIRPLSGSGKTGSDQVNVSLTTMASSRTYNVTSNGTLGEFIPATPFANFIGRVTDPSQLATVLGLQQIAQTDNFRTNLGLVEAAGKPVSVLASVFDPSGKKVLDIPVDLKANEQRQLNSFLAQNKIVLSNGRIEVKVTGGDGKVTAYASVVDNRSGDPYLVSPVALGQTSADTYVLPGVADVNTGFAAWRTDMTVLNSGTVPQLVTLTFYAQGSSDTPKSTSMTVNPGELKVLDNVLPSFLATTNAGGAVHVTTPIPSSLVVAGHTYDLTANGTKGQFIPAVTAIDAAGKGDRDLQILQVEDSSRYYTNIGITEVTGKPVTVEVAVVLPDSKVSPKAQIALAANGFFQQDLIQAIGMSNVYNARVTVRVVDGDGKITAYGSVIDQKTKDATYVPAQ